MELTVLNKKEAKIYDVVFNKLGINRTIEELKKENENLKAKYESHEKTINELKNLIIQINSNLQVNNLKNVNAILEDWMPKGHVINEEFDSEEEE